MAHYQIIIETRPMPTGGYRATVAEGPGWARRLSVSDPDAKDAGEAALWLRMDVRAAGEGADDFDFLHANL